MGIPCLQQKSIPARTRAMKSQWNDAAAQELVGAYAAKGVGLDIALRVYTTRLLRALDALSDEAMVNVQRLNLLDSSAPNPSVETLLHAFLPHKFVDHTHAASVLSLVDQPDGEALAGEVYDGRMGIVPYIAPGFGLAKEAARVFEERPDVEGLILHKHGIFTFGETAREAYEPSWPRPAHRVPGAEACECYGEGARDCADHPRRVRDQAGRKRANTINRRLPHWAEDPLLRQRRGARVL
jgi:rhamnose utilization protein RhaD (predicted bifunctional aldolase and dehydrogenase)